MDDFQNHEPIPMKIQILKIQILLKLQKNDPRHFKIYIYYMSVCVCVYIYMYIYFWWSALKI